MHTYAPPSRIGPDATQSQIGESLHRCKALQTKLPPMEGSVKYKRAWSTEESLEQHQSLMKQHELQSSIGQNHVMLRKAQADFLRFEAEAAAANLRQVLATVHNSPAASGATRTMTEALERARRATEELQLALKVFEIEEARAAEKTRRMEEEIEKCTHEMHGLREALEDVARGGGPTVVGLPLPNGKTASATVEDKDRKFFYCSDCNVGGHGQRFCNYFLKRPNWRAYPSEKWFVEGKGAVSLCPLGRRGVDFTDETYFSRISMHLKGRIWLEDKRKLYEFVPDLMPYTYVISDQKWEGEAPPPEGDDVPPMPWFVKETDRNWGTSVVCCQRPQECMSLAKAGAVYVVQRHIERPMVYDNGEKFHIKFYNLIYGLEDGVTWRLYCYKSGYLCISPKKWEPTDLSKEGQVTIIRSKRIDDWPLWERVYPLCKASIAEVVKRAAAEGKLEGRNKKQFEIISSDFVINEDFQVYLLEFNSGPVLKDPEDSPENHDAGMIMGALHIVEPWEHGDIENWDLALECKGIPPKPDE